MQSNKRYKYFTAVALCIFIYILGTEVLGRFEQSVEQYSELSAKQKTVLTPEEFTLRKRELNIEKEHLTLLAKEHQSLIKLNQGGVFEYLNLHAKNTGIVVKSIIPAEEKIVGRAKSIGFTMNFGGKYHNAAKFVNEIESGSIPININKILCSSDPIGNANLVVVIEGQARFLTETE